MSDVSEKCAACGVFITDGAVQRIAIASFGLHDSDVAPGDLLCRSCDCVPWAAGLVLTAYGETARRLRDAMRRPYPRVDTTELDNLRRDLVLARQELAAYKSRFLQTAAQAPAWREERAELVRQLDEARAAYDALLAGAVEAPKVPDPPERPVEKVTALGATYGRSVAAQNAPKLSMPAVERALRNLRREFKAEARRIVDELRSYTDESIRNSLPRG